MQTHHQREKGAFGQGCLQTKQQLLLVRAFPYTLQLQAEEQKTFNECAILFHGFVLNCRAQPFFLQPFLNRS